MNIFTGFDNAKLPSKSILFVYTAEKQFKFINTLEEKEHFQSTLWIEEYTNSC